MIDGIINLDTERGRVLGFTIDRYDGYLWKTGDSIIISLIESKQRGNFRELVQRIHEHGWTVKVPTPLSRMEEIVRKNGYRLTIEPFSDEDPIPCEVWVLPPPNNLLRP
jgi:hypothetical protein